MAFLVTGGASGLGLAAAAALVRDAGCKVVLADMDRAKVEAAAKALGDDTVARAVVMDVTVPATILAALDQCDSAFGGVRGVINCAGVGAAAKTVSGGVPHDAQLYEFVIGVNLIGTFNVCSLAAARMVRQDADTDGGRGVIITVASTAAFDGQKGQLAYAASKGGVAAMTLPMARDLARHGIRVVTIAPGPFATPMGLAISERAKESLLRDVIWPKRMGDPPEFGALCCAIARNSYINATTIRLDGGIRMSNL